MHRLSTMSVARAIEERVMESIMVGMMPKIAVVPRISPWPVPRIIPSCPICAAIPISIINPRIIEPSAIEPRVIPSCIIGGAVYPPAISIRCPCVTIAEAHERIHVDCGDFRILQVECERLRRLRDCFPDGCRAVRGVKHSRFRKFRERVSLLLVLGELCRGYLFRCRVVYAVILASGLCRSSTGRHHDAAYRQRHDSRHS